MKIHQFQTNNRSVKFQNRVSLILLWAISCGLFDQYYNFSTLSELEISNLWNYLKQKDVLVIDDDNNFRETLVALLRTRFRNVHGVISGFDGIDEIKNGNNFDIIFLDMFMDNHIALDVYDELMESSEEALIIIITAKTNCSEYEIAISKGIPVAPKPIDDELYLRISRFLQNKS